MPDVPGPLRAEHRLYLPAQLLAQDMVDVYQALAPAIGDVECLAARLVRGLACPEVCLDDVVDVSEVPGLPAVPTKLLENV